MLKKTEGSPRMSQKDLESLTQMPIMQEATDQTVSNKKEHVLHLNTPHAVLPLAIHNHTGLVVSPGNEVVGVAIVNWVLFWGG